MGTLIGVLRSRRLLVLVAAAIALLSAQPAGAISITDSYSPTERWLYDLPSGMKFYPSAKAYDTADAITSTSKIDDCVAIISNFSDPEDPRWLTGGPGTIEVALTDKTTLGDENGGFTRFSSFGGIDLAASLLTSPIRPSGRFDLFWRARCSRYTLTLSPSYSKVFDRFELSSTIETLRIVPRPNPQCMDGVDNDGDGLADVADLDCTWDHDDTEATSERSKLSKQMLRWAAERAARRAADRRFEFDDSLYYFKFKCRRRTPYSGYCDVAWIYSRRHFYVARVSMKSAVNNKLREATEVHATSVAARTSLRCAAKRRRCHFRYFPRKQKVIRDLAGLRGPARSVIYDFYSANDQSYDNPFGDPYEY